MDNQNQSQIFRQKSLDQISSPEQLQDYLHVTNPTIWLVLAAVLLLLFGAVIWSSVASVDSFASATATVKNGSMTIHLDDPDLAKNVQSGMKVMVADGSTEVTSVGHDADGTMFAIAHTDLDDGTYEAKVVLRQTQVLSLLFN